MRTFDVSNSIKLLTIVVIIISLALILAIVLGLTLPKETPPTGNLDGSTPNDDQQEVSTQVLNPVWFKDAENLEFFVQDQSLSVSIIP